MKNFIFTILAACTFVLASCSQEETLPQSITNGTVTLSVCVPSASQAVTRAVGLDGYTIRCIMSVVDAATMSTEYDRQVADASTGSASFSFTVPEAEYICLFWADYIEGTVTEFATDQTQDLFYDTTNLTAVAIKNTASAAFGDAADAFCGYVTQANIANGVTLTRPLVNLAMNLTIEAGLDLSAYSTLTVAYADVPADYNVYDGSSTTTTTVTYTGYFAGSSYDGTEANTLSFNIYILAASGASTWNGTITMTLSGDGVDSKSYSITPTTGVALDGNVKITASGTLNPEIEETVEVTIDDEYASGSTEGGEGTGITTLDIPALGQFVYSDGTWGDDYVSGTTIGIIFALADDTITDNSTYPDSFSDMTRVAYAMAIEGTKRAKIFNNSETSVPTLTGTATGTTVAELFPSDKDYSGYAYTPTMISEIFTYSNTYTSPLYNNNYVALTQTTYAITASNLSDWYIPSSSQVYDFTVMCCGLQDGTGINTAVQTAYQTAVTNLASDGSHMGANHTSACWVLSSCYNSTNFAKIQIATSDEYVEENIQALGTTQQGAIRPVLTVFSSAE